MANQGLPGGSIGRELRRLLAPREPILAWATGKSGKLLAATDRRAIIIRKGLWGGTQSNSYGYNQITSVEMRKDVLDGHVEISTGGVQSRRVGSIGQLAAENIVPFTRGSLDAFQRVVDVIRQHLYASVVQAGQPMPVPSQDIPSQIAALAHLRDQGALSEAEFEAKKAELLARM